MLRIDYESKITFKSHLILPYCRDLQHFIFVTFVYIICHVSFSGISTSCWLQLKPEIYILEDLLIQINILIQSSTLVKFNFQSSTALYTTCILAWPSRLSES